MADAPKLLGTDTLRQAYPKFNQAIDNANEALGAANTAKSTADSALAKSNNTQTQLDNVVINGDSSVEAAQARVAVDGTTYTTLKERLDTEQTIIEKLDKRVKWISVKEFGAIGDGVVDDTTAIQNALNSARSVYFPVGIYRVTNTLNLPQTVVMNGDKYSIDINTEHSSVVFFDSIVENAPLFTSSEPNHKISNLYFKGVNFGTDRRLWSKCFVFNKGSEFGDTDVTINDCHFFRFSNSIELEGRGLRLDRNSFVEQWNPIILKHFNNDETANPPQFDWQTNIRGFRKFHFVGNEFHSCQGHAFVCESTSSNNYEKYIHQVVVTGNRHDGTGGFWKGYIGGGIITGNTLGKSSSVVYNSDIHVFDLAGAKSVVISGNSFASELDLSDILGRKPYLGDIFYFRANGDFFNININGNTITGAGRRLIHAFSGPQKLTFSNNLVYGVCLEKTATTDRAFQFNAQGNTIVIKNNVITNTGGFSHDNLIYFAGRGTQGCSIEGNIFETTEFSLSHNLYAYNAQDNVKMTNYTGNGATSQTITFSQPVLFVVIAEYGTPKTIMKRVGTSNGDSLVSITDNTVQVKGIYNTNAVAYSIIAYCV